MQDGALDEGVDAVGVGRGDAERHERHHGGLAAPELVRRPAQKRHAAVDEQHRGERRHDPVRAGERERDGERHPHGRGQQQDGNRQHEAREEPPLEVRPVHRHAAPGGVLSGRAVPHILVFAVMPAHPPRLAFIGCPACAIEHQGRTRQRHRAGAEANRCTAETRRSGGRKRLSPPCPRRAALCAQDHRDGGRATPTNRCCAASSTNTRAMCRTGSRQIEFSGRKTGSRDAPVVFGTEYT